MQTPPILLCALAAVFCAPLAAAQSPEPVRDIRSPRATRIAATQRFAFHSDPWLGLHLFLYQWAREDRGLEIGRHPVPMPERSSVGELSAADQVVWRGAVEFYRGAVASRGHFDNDMMRTQARLVHLDGDVSAAPPDVIPGIAAVLRAAMPIYVKTWWTRHDAANRRWIGNVMAPLGRHENAFVELTRKVRGSVWPDIPWRVDVTAYPNYRAGYTTFEGHIVMFSTDPRNQGLHALEMVIHEVQHADPIH